MKDIDLEKKLGKQEEPLPVIKFDFDLDGEEGQSGFSMKSRRRTGRKRSYVADAIPQYIYFVVSLIWLEFMYHIFTFHDIGIKILFPIMFALAIAGVYTLLTGFFPAKVNRIIMWILMSLMSLLYMVELVYYSIFKQPLFLYGAAAGGGDATNYWKEALEAVVKNGLGIILIFVPLVVLPFVLRRYFSCRRRPLQLQGIFLLATILLYIIPIFILSIGSKADGSVKVLYQDYSIDVNKSIEDMGVITTIRLDTKNLLKKELGKIFPSLRDDDIGDDLVIINTPTPSSDSVDVSNPNQASSSPEVLVSPTPDPFTPNVMDIDFESLIAEEKDDTITDMHKYFASLTPSKKNEYTGLFKGYNLIQLSAEGFSPYCVDEKLTPTLYKLIHEGFVFNNFYTPLWQTSTSDGEFVNCVGVVPDQQHSLRHTKNNSLPFTMAHQFNRLGVVSKAYHDNSLSYYERNLTHTNMGYDFKAALLGNLSEKEYGKQIFSMEHPKAWPQSDLEMMQSTVPEYVNEDTFHAYYMTVSGHMNYTFSGNSMSAKNKELVADLPYSEEAKAYIACNIELDKALESLIQQLETAGVLDKTVICLGADHYPYAMAKSAINEIAGHKVEEDFEIYKNNLIIWNSAMEEPIQIDKPVSSLDIIPTLSNLFGFTYDSRLLLGTDALSDSDGLVILANRSFITDKVMYNTSNSEVTNLTDEEIPENYVKNISQIIKNKFVISKGIIDNDYYSYLEEELLFE